MFVTVKTSSSKPPRSTRGTKFSQRSRERGEDDRAQERKRSRLCHQKRTAAGLCSYGGCSEKAEVGGRQCKSHLRQMAKRAYERTKWRKAQGLCTYCGARPQFWGSKCVFCRQLFAKSPLPAAAKRALRRYREEQAKNLHDQIRRDTQAAVLKLLATNEVRGRSAVALELYAGLDNGKWKTYRQVAELMDTTKQNVHRLLRPLKLILCSELSGRVPWAPRNLQTEWLLSDEASDYPIGK